MSQATETLSAAFAHAMKIRPKVGGFPVLAEVLRQAGVTHNIWTLPACQSVFLTNQGPVLMQEQPLVIGLTDIPPFDQKALTEAIKIDQAGESTFPEFLDAAWKAGVSSYTVDFAKRTVSYYGCHGESYFEGYPAVKLP